MPEPKIIMAQISKITGELIATGLCIDQNEPILKKDGESVLVSFSGMTEISITLKDIPYHQSYDVLIKNRCFNIKFVDGGLLQMLYRFEGNEITKHRLAFFPSPDLLEYQNNSEVYELDEMYSDVLDKNIVTTPIRFDFDPDNSVEYHHPQCHLTIGQYKNCRIPVSGPLSPFIFINFILRAFYNNSYRKFSELITFHSNEFEQTITASEIAHLHVIAGRE